MLLMFLTILRVTEINIVNNFTLILELNNEGLLHLQSDHTFVTSSLGD